MREFASAFLEILEIIAVLVALAIISASLLVFCLTLSSC
jgi:hypothetical protein